VSLSYYEWNGDACMNNISIIAVATNYTYHIYRNFICSLYNTGYEGECFILIDEKSIPETRGLRGTFIPIEKYLPDNLDIHIQNYRLKIYQNILQDYQVPGSHIFFCDFRDLLFQKNINDYPLGDHELYLFQEDQTIKNCGFNGSNYDRIKANVFKHIDYKDQPILCSGTILIKNNLALDFMKQYYIFARQCLDYLDPATKKTLIEDQDVLNYMYYDNQIELNTKVLTNLDNFVNTMGYAVKPEINTATVNDQGYIVNTNGEISYIGHQFDRLGQRQLFKLFSKFPFISTGHVIL
jgi:hypothetical protein